MYIKMKKINKDYPVKRDNDVIEQITQSSRVMTNL